MVWEDSEPKPNIYSNKLLFENGDNRNKKRMAQMLRRKTALSAKHGSKGNGKDMVSKSSPLVQKENKTDNSSKNIINQKKVITNNDINNNLELENGINPRAKLESDFINDLKNNVICESNIVNLDCSPIISNNTFFNENNYYNNSSTNNSNNNSIINRDSQEKEVNISNLDNDSFDDIIINKEVNNQDDGCININNENEKMLSKSLYNYDQDDDHILIREERKIKEENEYALKYLTSSSDSFVQLDNHLVAKAKAQGGEMTESYIQALFPDLIMDPNKPLKTKNYEVTEIIKEEREFESPLGKINFYSKMNNKSNKHIFDRNLTLNNENSINDVKKLKKTLVKTMSNIQLLNKNNHLKDNNQKNENDKHKSVSSFKIIKNLLKDSKKELKTNINYKEKLNISSSYLNLKKDKIKNKKMNLKLKSTSDLNSTFSSNLYTKEKIDDRPNKIFRNKKKMKDSFTSLFDVGGELNDVLLIHNCVKKLGKSKNQKISKHYLKNINFYTKKKESDNKNKMIKIRNKNENVINKTNYLNIQTKTSKLNHINSTDVTKNIKLVKNNSKKKLDRNSKNNINLNINTIHKMKNDANKSFTHKCCITTTSLNENIKPKKYLTKNDRVKSCSRLNLRNHQNNEIVNTDSNLRRSKSNHKKLNILTNTCHINTESSVIKIKTRKSNINSNNKIIIDKKKSLNFHKKIDYSYVKAKVETGLSEDVLKKLLSINKKLMNKEKGKKLETDKKQSLLTKCKTSMIEGFKTMASNIKNKIFKKDKNEKYNNNEEINCNNMISNKNRKRKSTNIFCSCKK